VLVLLFIILFIGVADNQLISPLLPMISASIQTSAARLGRIVTAYALAAAVASLIIGYLSDIKGRVIFLRLAAFIFAIVSIITALAPGYNTLLLSRTMTGMAAGAFSTCAISFAGDYFPYEKRGLAMGIISTSYFAAVTIGVVAGTQLAGSYGWRAVYYGLALLGLIAFALVMRYLPEQQIKGSKSVGVFASYLSFFNRRSTCAGIIVSFLFSGGLVGFITYLGDWLSRTFQIKTQTIGIVFLIGGLATFVAAPVAGKLSDRVSKKSVIIIGNIILAAGFAVVPYLNWPGALLAGFSLVSAAAAFRQGPLQALTTELIGASERGAYIAVRNTASQLGIASFVLVSGLCYEAYGYAAVALAMAAVTLLATVFVLIIKEPDESNSPTA